MNTIIVLSLLSALSVQPEITPSTATNVVSATDVLNWKVDVFNNLTSIGQQPYDVMANLFLTNAIGMATIPQGTETITIPSSSYQRFNNIHRYIKAAAGLLLVNTMSSMGITDKKSLSNTIDAAAETIKDKKKRDQFLDKTKNLKE